MSSVRLTQIRKSFGSNPIVKGVDLTVNEGEFLVMVGPSGCGKTTLLRLIAGLEVADSGQIAMGDREVTNVPPRDRDVGMVFQSYALYPHMSVRENLGFGLSIRNLPAEEIKQRVEDVAASLELGALLDRKPRELSGGQRQRVAMGRVIVRRPSVFLFDEPLSNLDTALRVQMRSELARLHRKLGVTMIYVTHDQVEAMTLATRVAVFNQGVLQQIGPPLELYNRPANTFVATFLGSPAMNLLKASVQNGSLSVEGLQVPTSASERDVLLGLRPQDLRIASSGAFTGTIESLERLGFDGFATVKTASGEITARFDASVTVDLGQKVSIAADAKNAHVFSSDGTRALQHPGGA